SSPGYQLLQLPPHVLLADLVVADHGRDVDPLILAMDIAHDGLREIHRDTEVGDKTRVAATGGAGAQNGLPRHIFNDLAKNLVGREVGRLRSDKYLHLAVVTEHLADLFDQGRRLKW